MYEKLHGISSPRSHPFTLHPPLSLLPHSNNSAKRAQFHRCYFPGKKIPSPEQAIQNAMQKKSVNGNKTTGNTNMDKSP
jgi:hypothetical protein